MRRRVITIVGDGGEKLAYIQSALLLNRVVTIERGHLKDARDKLLEADGVALHTIQFGGVATERFSPRQADGES